MGEQASASDELMSEATRQRMDKLRRALLRLHKALLNDERLAYERVYGPVTGGELLQLVINHEQFNWLHAVSQFIVRIDEMLDAEEPVTGTDAESLLIQARGLLKPTEEGTEFERNYLAALQRDPDVVLAHREVTKLL